jgi:type I restriction enzyme S subunit
MSEAVLDTRKVRSWRKYPSYQTIELDWVDHVPDHWIVKRLKWSIASCQNGIWGDEPTGDEDDVGCVRVADFDRLRFVLDDSVELTKRSVPKDKQVGRLLNRGDLLLEKSGGGDNQPVGTLVLFDSDAIAVCSNFVAKVAVADGYCGSYLRYLHACLYANRVNTRSMKQATGIQNLDSGQYFDEKVAFPSLDEQRAIAAFLDRETARIDSLVAKKQRLIELLEEKRQSIISNAVTKGLNPAVEKIESGIEWFGKIPKSWKVTRLGWACETINDINHEMPDAVSEGIPFLSAKDLLNDGSLNFKENIKFISEEDFTRLSKKILPQRDDIIYSRIGACLGKARLVETDVPFLVSYSCCVVRVNKQVALPAYFRHLLDNEIVLIEATMRTQGIGVPDLGLKQISRFPIPLPPLEEQKAIVSYLDKTLLALRSLVSRVHDGIKRLEEYRSALISTAVTGQIDVREEVPLDA